MKNERVEWSGVEGPRDPAMRSGHDDVVRYLRAVGARYGANINWDQRNTYIADDGPGSRGPGEGGFLSSGSPSTSTHMHRVNSDLHHLTHSSLGEAALNGVGGVSTPRSKGGTNGDIVSLVQPSTPDTLARGQAGSQSSNDLLHAALMRKGGSMVEFENNGNGHDATSEIGGGVTPLKIPTGNMFGPEFTGDDPHASETAGHGPLGSKPSLSQGVYFLPDGTAEWELLPLDVSVYDVVGEGAFGEIRSGKWRGCPVAIKTLKSDCMTDQIALKEFNCEMSIWCRLVHPNIVQFLGVGCKVGQTPIMVCELMSGGSLQQKLHELQGWGKKLDFDRAFKIGSNVAAALHYMHSRRPHAVIHRDLKPANILLTSSGTAKVADFGLSKMFDISTPRKPMSKEIDSPTASPSSSHNRGGASQDKYLDAVYSQLYSHAFLMTGETGAYKYMAPEVFRHEFYGLKCDVYSFAIVMYELFEGLIQLGDPITWAHKAAGKEELRPGWMYMTAYDTRRCQEMSELVEQCWHSDPAERPMFLNIVKVMNAIGRISKYDKSQSPAAGNNAGSSQDAPGCACAVM